MNDPASIRDRYLQDNASVRLGGLAANLARASARSCHASNGVAVHGLIEESKWFIEWTAADFVSDAIETVAELVELQVLLSCRQINWAVRWANPTFRAQFATEAREWSDRVMAMSGLLG